MSDTHSRVLIPCQPYTFANALTYFTRRAGELVDRAEGGAYRRLFALPAGRFLAEVREEPGGQPEDNSDDRGGGSRSTPPALAGRGTELRLSVTAAEPGLPEGDRQAAADEIEVTLTRTLGLRDDLDAFRAVAGTDPVLQAIVERYAGLRLISTPTPFEAFVWAVIGQQISLSVAFRLKAALVRRFGISAEVSGETYHAFPTPDVLARADPGELAALGLGQRKSATLVHTAAAIVAGELDLDALAGLSLDEAERVLTALHGVGPWTAHYVLLRGLRNADAIPVSDMGLRVAVGAAYDLGRKADVAEVASFAECWRPFRGYAAFYLWYSLAELGRSGDG